MEAESNHANAILGVGWKDGEVYICSEIYVFEKDTEEIIGLANQAKVDRRVEMFCDSAEPDRIKTWQKAGFRAYPVKKEPGSVKAQIDWLKGRKIHIHPSCVNVLKEVQQWKWKKDPTTGLYIDEPVEFMDDARERSVTPNAGNANNARNVNTDGSLNNNNAYNGNNGVRPDLVENGTD